MLFGDVGVGDHRVLRQGRGHVGDGVHQLAADPLPLLRQGRLGPEGDGLAVIDGLQPGRQVHGHEGQGLTRPLVVEPGHVHELILEIVDDVVVFGVALREDHDPAPLLEPGHRLAEGGHHPAVVVDGDGVGVVEDQHRQGHDEMAQQAEKGPQGPGLIGPEVPVGVVRHLPGVHHLPDAPDLVGSRGVYLGGDGAVHLAVVAHDHAGALRQMLCPLDPVLGGEQPDQPVDDPVEQRGLFFFHRSSLPGPVRFFLWQPGSGCSRGFVHHSCGALKLYCSTDRGIWQGRGDGGACVFADACRLWSSFLVLSLTAKKQGTQKGALSFWCAVQDSNLLSFCYLSLFLIDSSFFVYSYHFYKPFLAGSPRLVPFNFILLRLKIRLKQRTISIVRSVIFNTPTAANDAYAHSTPKPIQYVIVAKNDIICHNSRE